MGISIYKIKKWARMIAGKSIYHVNQGPGLLFSKTELKGYYNNLTEKVLRCTCPSNEVPSSIVDSGEKVFFSIAIFQYGLGAYDLYLKDGKDDYLQMVYTCANWAVDNQEKNGGWKTFLHKKETHPYSAMAQGEGISLLLRAYEISKNESFLASAKKAMSFLLTPIENGGVTKYEGENVYFMECLYLPLVLNGWIFSIWGLIDYCKVVKDEIVNDALKRTLISLKNKLSDFDTGYWSKYEESKMIASPFYHSLHIAQLNVMFDLTGEESFKAYADRWSGYQNSFIKPKYAFVKKALQKIMERS